MPDRRRVHVLLRSHGVENRKSRPDFYDKQTCLASLLRAVEHTGGRAELLLVNDGPIPPPRAELMAAAGEVVELHAGSNRASYRATIDIACTRDWPPNDVVWFAEDDYLYDPGALTALLEGVEALPRAHYFSLHSPYALDRSAGRRHPIERPERGAVGDPDAVSVGGTRWFHGLSSTSTFGVLVGALVEDRRLLRILPLTGGAWDHTSSLAVQGQRPFTLDELRPDLLPFRGQSVDQWPRALFRGTTRVAANVRALRRRSRCRVLMSSDPPWIAHVESGQYEDEERWAGLAEESREWEAQRAAPISSSYDSAGETGPT